MPDLTGIYGEKGIWTMEDLMDMTLTEAAQICIDQVAEGFDLPKKQARKVFANAIVYNCVIEEIMGQVAFLLNRDLPNDFPHDADDDDF